MKRRLGAAAMVLSCCARLTLVVALLTGPGRVLASGAELCVSNESQLASALITAQAIPLTIKLVQGTYYLDSTLFHHNYGDVLVAGFQLLGGYSGPTCATRAIANGNTVLTDSSPPSNNTLYGAEFGGDATFEGITFALPHGFSIYYEQVDGVAQNTLLTLRRCTLAKPAGVGNAEAELLIVWDVDTSVDGTFRLVNNLSTDSAGPELVRFAINDGSPVLQAINNTFTKSGGDILVLDSYGAHASAFLYNNIFYSYGAYSGAVFIDTPADVLIDNVINEFGGASPNVPPIGTYTGDPQLNSNGRPIVSPPSPVINTGSNEVPGGLPAHDLDGGPRIVGTLVDRGAYESNIDNELVQIVSNNNDSGAGSLRAAINSANANGAALITFDLGSGCPHVITLDSALPALTAGVVINGYTQTGATANDLDVGDDATLCVILEAASNSVATGIQVASNAGDSAAVSIKGLGFSGFSTAAIDLQGGSGHFVSGNHFGGSIGGHALQPNGIDIRLGTAAHDALIGSDDVADRNIIGDATGSGIVLQGGASGSFVIGSNNNQILNNYIGVGWSVGAGNYTNRANGTRGIHLLGHDNTISGNVIGDNLQAGILVDGGGAVNNIIAGNFIGADASNIALGNGNAGIHLLGNIGDAPHDNTIRYNTLADNGSEGIWIGVGQHNKMRANSIYANGGLGIALVGESVLANDDDGGIQQTDYANRGQNYPVLTGAAGGYQSGRVSGSLTTTAGDYTVDIYVSPSCDASGHGEGRTWLRSGTVTVTVPAGLDQATATFDIAFKSMPLMPLLNGVAITATATDAAGDTSEFSACSSYLNDTIFANGFEQPQA